MGVSFSLGSAAPGHTTAFRGSRNEDIRKRDAIINHECRRVRSKVVLEEFKRTDDPLQPEFVLLLTPKPGAYGLDDIIEDMIKKLYLRSVSWNHIHDEGTVEHSAGKNDLSFREVDPLIHEGGFLDAPTQKPRFGYKRTHWLSITVSTDLQVSDDNFLP